MFRPLTIDGCNYHYCYYYDYHLLIFARPTIPTLFTCSFYVYMCMYIYICMTGTFLAFTPSELLLSSYTPKNQHDNGKTTIWRCIFDSKFIWFPASHVRFTGGYVFLETCTLFGTKTSTLLTPNESPRDPFDWPFRPHATFGGTRLLSQKNATWKWRWLVTLEGHKMGCRKNPITSWWFQPIWKICSSDWIISPN